MHVRKLPCGRKLFCCDLEIAKHKVCYLDCKCMDAGVPVLPPLSLLLWWWLALQPAAAFFFFFFFFFCCCCCCNCSRGALRAGLHQHQHSHQSTTITRTTATGWRASAASILSRQSSPGVLLSVLVRKQASGRHVVGKLFFLFCMLCFVFLACFEIPCKSQRGRNMPG